MNLFITIEWIFRQATLQKLIQSSFESQIRSFIAFTIGLSSGNWGDPLRKAQVSIYLRVRAFRWLQSSLWWKVARPTSLMARPLMNFLGARWMPPNDNQAANSKTQLLREAALQRTYAVVGMHTTPAEVNHLLFWAALLKRNAFVPIYSSDARATICCAFSSLLERVVGLSWETKTGAQF